MIGDVRAIYVCKVIIFFLYHPPSRHNQPYGPVPKAMGGKSDFANTVSSCFQCNARKDNRTPESAGMALKKRPHAPSVVGFIFQQIKHLGLDKVVEEYVNVKV